MNKKAHIIILTIISAVFCGCSAPLFMNSINSNIDCWLSKKRAHRIIKRCQKQTDTVYVLSACRTKPNLGWWWTEYIVWYHKNGYIHGFWISRRLPTRIKRLNSVESLNISLDGDEIEKYFGDPIFKELDVPCFECLLDAGETIEVYMIDKEPLFSYLDARCQFNTKFKPNSFPYKLQYDLSKLGWGFIPKDFDFEKMYSEP